MASEVHRCLHGRTIWFALRGIAPLWLLFRSPLRPYVAFPLCLRLFLEVMTSLLPPSHHPLALGPYPSRLPQTARLQAFSPARGIPEGSPRHLSPTASGAWRTRRALSASGRVRRSLLEQSCWSARAASSRPARGFPSEASLPGRLWLATVPGGCHDQGHSQRAEHDQMPPLPSFSMGLEFQENPKQLFVWGESERAQQASEGTVHRDSGSRETGPPCLGCGPGQDLLL